MLADRVHRRPGVASVGLPCRCWAYGSCAVACRGGAAKPRSSNTLTALQGLSTQSHEQGYSAFDTGCSLHAKYGAPSRVPKCNFVHSCCTWLVSQHHAGNVIIWQNAYLQHVGYPAICYFPARRHFFSSFDSAERAKRCHIFGGKWR
jgi:hypothetical protein